MYGLSERSSCSVFRTAAPELSGTSSDSLGSVNTMDVNKMLVELRQEREQIEEAIIILERLARGRGKRRGRPPLWMTATAAPAKRRGRPPGSKNKPKNENAAVA